MRSIRRVRPYLRIKVSAHLEFQWKACPPKMAQEIRHAFTYKNPVKAKKQRLNLWCGDTPDYVETFVDQDGTALLPRGGIGKLSKIVARHGWSLSIIDDRLELEEVDLSPRASAERVEDRVHQRALVDAIIRAETCLVRAATGSGKTEVAILAAQRVGQPTLVVVWSSGLQGQWVKRISKRLGWRESEVGVIGGGRYHLAPITVAMQQSLAPRLDDLRGRFGFLIGDEVQRWAAATFQAVANQFPARYRVGFSADERRKDGMEMLIHDVFGDVAATVGRDELIAQGHLCEVEIAVVPTETRMPELDLVLPEDRGAIVGQMWGEIVDLLIHDDARNEQIAELAAREVRAGRSTLVFTDRVEHAQELVRRIAVDHATPCGIAIGGAQNRDVLDETVRRLDKGDLRVAVATSCLYQGTDIPRLVTGIVATPTATNQQLLEQQCGRLRRKFPGKTRGTLYYMWDRNLFPGHVSNLRRWYGNELVRVKS